MEGADFIYDNEDILLELDGSNNITARYTHGPGIDGPLIMEKGGQSFFYHADGLGSITELTNQSGTVAQRYTYSSFGKIESQLDPNFIQPYTFTSREFDSETGLYFYRTRYYDPATGRFLQEDPVFNRLRPNLYSYVFDNPINLTDPSGKITLPTKLCLACLGTALAGLVGGAIAGCAAGCAGSCDFPQCFRRCIFTDPNTEAFQKALVICGAVCAFSQPDDEKPPDPEPKTPKEMPRLPEDFKEAA